jgi:hypothetical protein
MNLSPDGEAKGPGSGGMSGILTLLVYLLVLDWA